MSDVRQSLTIQWNGSVLTITHADPQIAAKWAANVIEEAVLHGVDPATQLTISGAVARVTLP